MSALPPGSTIGILGGGQLGRMLANAAAELGFDVAIYTPEADSPASRVAAHTIVGDYRDAAKLAVFAKQIDVVTSEFENVPAETAAVLIETRVRSQWRKIGSRKSASSTPMASPPRHSRR
jgi:5-(carboxyamino)imidazole ribonucleotide synthase